MNQPGTLTDRRTPRLFGAGRQHGRQQYVFQKAKLERRRAARRFPLLGFPVMEPFETKESMCEYFSHPKIQCLLCGRWFGRLGNHLTVHDWTEDKYRAHFGIPWTYGLCGQVAHGRYVMRGRERMEERDRTVVLEVLAGARERIKLTHRRGRVWKSSAAHMNPLVPSAETRTCEACQGPYVSLPSSNRKFCSHRCYVRVRFPNPSPPADCRSCGNRLPQGSWGKAVYSPVQCMNCRWGGGGGACVTPPEAPAMRQWSDPGPRK